MQFQTAQAAREFVLAGNAIVTFKSNKTGKHYTYKIEKPKNKPHFVKVLVGANNQDDYEFIGTIFDESSFRPGRNTNSEAKHIQGFAWVWKRLLMNELSELVQVLHEGRCGCCGRLLTTPESIQSGYGPTCAKKRQ